MREDIYEEYENMGLQDMAKELVEVRNRLDEAKREQSEIQRRYDYLRKSLIPAKMEDMGIDTVKLTGIGRLSLRAEAYAGFVREKKDEAIEWLRENGHGDLVRDEVPASTIKAFLKECQREGEVIPEDLFKFDPYMMATITKL